MSVSSHQNDKYTIMNIHEIISEQHTQEGWVSAGVKALTRSGQTAAKAASKSARAAKAAEMVASHYGSQTMKLLYALDIVKEVVNYNLKGSASTNKHIGVIAQELETIFPSLVSKNEPTIEDINTGKIESYKSVKYSCFTLILIKALQEEQEIINKLDSKIEVLNSLFISI